MGQKKGLRLGEVIKAFGPQSTFIQANDMITVITLIRTETRQTKIITLL